MAIESIDSVMEQLVLTGGSKIDWQEGESRSVDDGQWSIHDHADHKLFDGHLYPAMITRMQCLNVSIDVETPPNPLGPQAELLVMFDPVTRRIEAMEVWDTDTCGILLTLMFWPGLESARKLVIATMTQWKQAIDNGWFEGISDS